MNNKARGLLYRSGHPFEGCYPCGWQATLSTAIGKEIP